MNYYERHIGDYAKSAGHLTMLEHGAYTLLMDRYYATESGIPADQVHKVARATSKAEKQAVNSVLNEFFQLVDGLWIKNRCEEVIDAYLASLPAAELKKENDKERQRRARERRKALFAELKSRGVVMPWNTSVTVLQTELSRVTGGDGHAVVTVVNTASQSPIPNPQSDSRRDEASPVGTIATQIYRLAKQLNIAPGVITIELKAHSEAEVWQALGATLKEKPAESLGYFRGCLKKTEGERFKSA